MRRITELLEENKIENQSLNHENVSLLASSQQIVEDISIFSRLHNENLTKHEFNIKIVISENLFLLKETRGTWKYYQRKLYKTYKLWEI